MNEAMQRLLPAWLLTLAVHSLLLNWRLEQKSIKLPESEKISVTLRHPPPPQKKILKPIRKIPAVRQMQHKPLENLPPRQQKIVRQLPKPPQVTAAVLKPLVTLPPPQRRIARRRMPPTPIAVPVGLNLQPMTVPPPAQGRIFRQLPKLPVAAEALTKQYLPQPLQTLPPEPVWEDVAEEAVPEEVIEEIVELPVQETLPKEVFEEEPVWEEPVAPLPRQHYVQQKRRVVRRQPVEYYEQPRRTARRNYEQRPAASSSYGSDDREAAPRYDINPQPAYPIQARRRGLQGTVMLKVLVDAGGSVADVRLAESSGHSILDQAAINAVRGWIFTPGTTGGRPKQMWVMVPVRFVLN